MSSFIESVKNNIRQLRDNLETQYRGCDLQFAFVRYTDYVQPAALRTSLLDFTRWIDMKKAESLHLSFLKYPVCTYISFNDLPIVKT